MDKFSSGDQDADEDSLHATISELEKTLDEQMTSGEGDSAVVERQASPSEEIADQSQSDDSHANSLSEERQQSPARTVNEEPSSIGSTEDKLSSPAKTNVQQAKLTLDQTVSSNSILEEKENVVVRCEDGIQAEEKQLSPPSSPGKCLDKTTENTSETANEAISLPGNTSSATPASDQSHPSPTKTPPKLTGKNLSPRKSPSKFSERESDPYSPGKASTKFSGSESDPYSPRQTPTKFSGSESDPYSPRKTPTKLSGSETDSSSPGKTPPKLSGSETDLSSPGKTQTRLSGSETDLSSPAKTQTKCSGSEADPSSPRKTETKCSGSEADPSSPRKTETKCSDSEADPSSPRKTPSKFSGSESEPYSPRKTQTKIPGCESDQNSPRKTPTSFYESRGEKSSPEKEIEPFITPEPPVDAENDPLDGNNDPLGGVNECLDSAEASLNIKDNPLTSNVEDSQYQQVDETATSTKRREGPTSPMDLDGLSQRLKDSDILPSQKQGRSQKESFTTEEHSGQSQDDPLIGTHIDPPSASGDPLDDISKTTAEDRKYQKVDEAATSSKKRQSSTSAMELDELSLSNNLKRSRESDIVPKKKRGRPSKKSLIAQEDSVQAQDDLLVTNKDPVGVHNDPPSASGDPLDDVSKTTVEDRIYQKIDEAATSSKKRQSSTSAMELDELSLSNNFKRSRESDTSLQKKRGRPSKKDINYSEVDQEEKDKDEDFVMTKKRRSETVDDAKMGSNSTKDHHNGKGTTKLVKKRGRLPWKIKAAAAKKLESSTATTISEKTPTQEMNNVENSENTGGELFQRKIYRKVHPVDLENVSLFLPEGWLFYACKRQIGKECGKFDLYYVTSPPCKKLRSRIELTNYMEKRGLNYDPLKFFLRETIEPLLHKGILKYYNPRLVVPDLPHIEPLLTQHLNRKMLLGLARAETMPPEDAGQETEKLSPPPKSKVAASAEATVKKQRAASPESAGRKSKASCPEISGRKSKVSPAEALSRKSRAVSPEAVTKVARAASPVAVGRKSRATKVEKLSPDATSKTALPETTNRRLRAAKRERDTSTSESRTASPELKTNESNGMIPSTSPKKLRGRPRKSTSAVPELPPQSNSKVEEQVKIQSKPSKKSPYFSSSASQVEKSKGLEGLRKERNATNPPPRSPYNLIQEDLFHDPWQLLIATIFLNSTSGRLAIPLTLEFLKRWPTPQLARQAKIDDILDIIEPLGFGRTRAAIILRFSHEYLTKDWKLPNELYGIGEYGNDSYKVFCLKNAWKKVESDDPMLMMYLNWRKATEHLRKKFGRVKNDKKSVDPDEVSSLNPEESAAQFPQRQSTRQRLRTKTK